MTQAERELARRELARRNPQRFAEYVDPDYAGPYRYDHVRFLFDVYMRAFSGALWANMPGEGVRVLCVSMPPGHLKTSCTNKFSAWCLGRWFAAGEQHEIALISYGSTLAEANSRYLLELVDSQRYRNVFPDVRLSQKSRSVSQWSLAGAYGTSCVATGVGGGLTGFRARGLFIDDPVKDAAEANSQSRRDSVWDWWLTVGSTRLVDNSIVIVPHTRWHEDDLTGRIIKNSTENGGSYRVVVVRLPALAETQGERVAAHRMGYPLVMQDALGREPGAALCEEIESEGSLLARRKVAPSAFEALYQGRPRRVGGNLIGRDKFVELAALPTEQIDWCWATDWAITEKQASPARRNDPDYSVVALVGLWRPEGRERVRLVIGFVARVQANLHDAKRFVLKESAWRADVPLVAFRQAGIDRMAMRDIMAMPDAMNRRVKMIDRPRGDKLTLAQPWIDRAEGGFVYVVKGAWNEAFYSEVEAFPKGVHDDQVDAVSVGFYALGGVGKKVYRAVAKPGGFYG